MRDALRKLSNSDLSSLAADGGPLSSVEARAKIGGLFVSPVLGTFCQLAARTLLAILGCAAVAWGMYALPSFARQVTIERVATHVLEGDLFKSGVLAALVPQVEAAERAEPCSPAVVRSAAIIRTRMAEQAMVDGEDIDAQLNGLNESIHRALACSPADSFLWVELYWVETIQNGFRRDYLEYLRLSYQLGPNEGWIARNRNRLALAIFPQLPPDLASQVVSEFATLVQSGFTEETVANLVGPGWNVREALLAGLKDVPERNRNTLAKVLYHNGYDVIVPGIELPEPRPWQ